MDFPDGMVDLEMDQKWPFWPRSEADIGSAERGPAGRAGWDQKGAVLEPFLDGMVHFGVAILAPNRPK